MKNKNVFLKSSPIYFKDNKPSVDIATGTIKGVTIVQQGLNKNGYVINEQFIKDVVKLGNESTMGVKSRFGHPNLCDDALGTFLGRYTNFTYELMPEKSMGNPKGQMLCVKADLKLDAAAKLSPKGDLYSYVLKMAADNSDMFGNSIAFKVADEVETETIGEDEYDAPTITSLLASDLVDSPAATNSLFNSDTDFAALATEFLDENPQMIELLKSKPEVVESFMSKYLNNNTMKEEEKNPILKAINDLKEKVLSVLPKHEELGEKNGTMCMSTEDSSLHTILHGKKETPSPGHKVVDGEGSASPDGEYHLMAGGKKNGKTAKVAGGEVSSVSKIDDGDGPDAEPDNDEAMSALKMELATEKENYLKLLKSIEEKDAKILALKETVTAKELQVTNFQMKLGEIASELTALKSTIESAELNIPITGEKGKVITHPSAVKLSKAEILEKVKAAEEYQKSKKVN